MWWRTSGVFPPRVTNGCDLFLLLGAIVMAPNVLPGVKPRVLVTHGEPTFGANDGKPKLRIPKGRQPIRPKGK